MEPKFTPEIPGDFPFQLEVAHEPSMAFGLFGLLFVLGVLALITVGIVCLVVVILAKKKGAGDMSDPYQNSTEYVNDQNQSGQPAMIWGMAQNSYLMLMHLSQFLSCIPPLGWVAPILLWVLNKDTNSEVDIHGKIILNWIISSGIYMVGSGVLCIVLVGFLLLPAIIIINFVFVIVGAIKANDGIRWKYPLSIPFFKV